MKNIFINIHGFGSSGANSKAAALIKNYPDHELISPDLPADPLECLEIIDAIVVGNIERPIVMQGSSMGGLYSMIMHIRHGVPALLINPALTPATLVRNRLGETYEFANGDSIVIAQEHVDRFAIAEKELEEGITENKIKQGHLLALIGEQDELLDQNIMKSILKRAGAEIISYDNDHQFQGYDEVSLTDERVKEFLLSGRG
ncbi:YqiA/YcfP family alpha/beta fold hydrolase [Maridesulfovibrio sp.]|uniref:YqiA/YcfP family alpha/beta fold hydrolase n=1 Tax=Maridesulfovibrio sp. TaxID=2795000 RepID=UPI0029F5899B|nr:YqiA/YcfP family alpha/beta fold hydrolase [Maridesulfovibrio sp.]